MKYRKKPGMVEAFQMTEERRMDNSEWPVWLHEAWNGVADEEGTLQRHSRDAHMPDLLEIVTLEGKRLVSWGDWIIRGVKGKLYPCKPDIFAATYDEVMPSTKDASKRFTDDLDKATLFGAIARGWCHEENVAKEMDVDLAMAIAFEVVDIVIAKDATIDRLTAELEAARAQIGAVLQEAADLRDALADKIGARPMSSIHSALCEYRKAILALNPEAIAANAKRREPQGLILTLPPETVINWGVKNGLGFILDRQPRPNEDCAQTFEEEVARLRDSQIPDQDGFCALIKEAKCEAEKAMRKFPQPNYVISKVAEEAGEVVKAAIHCAEARETAENLRGEMKQLIAMLYRLWVEGDQVHGLLPVGPTGETP